MLPFFKSSKNKLLYLAYTAQAHPLSLAPPHKSGWERDRTLALVFNKKTTRAGQFDLNVESKEYGLKAEFEGVFQEKKMLEERNLSSQSVLFLIAHSFHTVKDSNLKALILRQHVHSYFQYKFISYLNHIAKTSNTQTIAFYLPLKTAAILTVLKHHCHTWMSVLQGGNQYVLGVMDVCKKTQDYLKKCEGKAALKAQQDLWEIQKKDPFMRSYLKDTPLHTFWPLRSFDTDSQPF